MRLSRPDTNDLVTLDPDHPGFRDPDYRARRNTIARIALDWRGGDAVPDAPYTDEEHAVWAHVWSQLDPLHATHVCQEVLELQRILPLDRARIPQLAEVNRELVRAAGFHMEPVAGLVSARAFMRHLGRRVFLSTQYVRHHSRPLYTPEPDILHELVGHAATLVHPGIAELNRLLGLAAEASNDEEMHLVDHVYWYTMEFGVVEEAGDAKAFGAGLLSSCGELRDFRTHARLLPWDIDRIARTPFDPTRYQDVLFVAPSFTRMLVDVSAWVRTEQWRRTT